MKKILLLIVITCFAAGSLFGQEEYWKQWDAELLIAANTAKEISGYSEEEKAVVQLMNLARLNGKLFATTYLAGYVEEKGTEKTHYLKSLISDLDNVSGRQLLIPENDLSEIAVGHATASGKTGHVGHKDMQKRFDSVLGHPYNHVAENCSYGYNTAMDIVITLLIDENVESLGHRKNILSPDLNSVGVSIKPHSVWNFNCVIDFGAKKRTTAD